MEIVILVDIIIKVNKKFLNSKPSITITSPKKDEKVSNTIYIYGVASDEFYVAKVEIRIDNGNWQEVKGTNTWSFSFDTTKLSDREFRKCNYN